MHRRWFRQIRWVAHKAAYGLAVATVGLVHLMIFGTQHSRGFLPSFQADYWIRAIHSFNGAWAFEVLQVDGDVPDQGAVGYTVLLQEQSSGRTGGMFGAFRASHWTFIYAELPGGGYIDELPDFRIDDGFDEAFEAFVMTEIVPTSPSMRAWPHTEGSWMLSSEPLHWSYWRRGTFVDQFVVFSLISLALGAATIFGADRLLKPLRQWYQC